MGQRRVTVTITARRWALLEAAAARARGRDGAPWTAARLLGELIDRYAARAVDDRQWRRLTAAVRALKPSPPPGGQGLPSCGALNPDEH